ncbi:MAG: putative 7-carboxy-7-deazaguanine synthase QueE [Defluviitaleaceae bacterium]|nr:putative 7-carboxy-7-deazaguanine synthase QueE [Defluviitaleaceae bacterium]
MYQYQIIETFTSIDGEGPSSGALSTFIRFSGCNLRCSWCDTKYSWDGSCTPDVMDEAAIYAYIKEAGAHNVTLTGGEPLIQPHIGELIALLVQDDALTIRIETHGGVDIEPFKARFKDQAVQFVVDFKLPDSKMMKQMHLPNLTVVEKQDTYKFVIASERDLDQAIEIVNDYQLIDRCQVYFSPVVELIEPKLIVERMMADRLNGIRLQLQLHKYIWPKEMRGV